MEVQELEEDGDQVAGASGGALDGGQRVAAVGPDGGLGGVGLLDQFTPGARAPGGGEGQGVEVHAQHLVGPRCLQAAVVHHTRVEGTRVRLRLPITFKWAASSTLLSDVLASGRQSHQAVLEVQERNRGRRGAPAPSHSFSPDRGGGPSGLWVSTVCCQKGLGCRVDRASCSAAMKSA